MKTSPLLLSALLPFASGHAISSTCYFGLTARGPVNGTILTTSEGETRVGGTFPPSNFTISAHVLSTDSNQTCTVSSPTSQFQCAVGVPSSTNFTLADNGALLHDGVEDWWACEVDGPDASGSWEIYGFDQNKTGCEVISLITGGFSCAALGARGSTPTASIGAGYNTSLSTASTSATPTSTAITCPTSLLNATTYLEPDFIKPISSASPNTSFPSTNGSVTISEVNSTLLNFAIPATAPYDSTLSNTCALIFLLPYASQLANSSGFYFSGLEEEVGMQGAIDFTLLSEIADESTTWQTINTTSTSILLDLARVEIIPGNAYEVARFECAGDRRLTIQMSSVNDVELDYVQDSREVPIGSFIVPCV